MGTRSNGRQRPTPSSSSLLRSKNDWHKKNTGGGWWSACWGAGGGGLAATTGGVASGGTGAVSSSGGGQRLGGQTIAKTFQGIGAAWLLVGLAAAGLLAYGSRRLIVDLVDKPPATCPLEVRR